ncbi:MAG: Hpt domain-containing protein [Chromatiales bacterium]|nr:Hpt domain-containing protein [Chromatiales bacterium]
MPSPEVLAVLVDEVADVVDGMSAALGELNAASNAERLHEALAFFSEQIGRIDAAAELLSLAGLQQICRKVRDNVARLEGADGSHAALAVFLRGPNLILDYLRHPKDPQTGQALTRYLADSHWPQPISAAESTALAAMLADIDESPAEGEARAARPTHAQPGDVVLDIAADVNPALVEAFLAEGPLQAGAYTGLVERVIRGGAALETLNEARRLVHTIKGAANTVGVRGLATLTHHLEDLLEHTGRARTAAAGRGRQAVDRRGRLPGDDVRVAAGGRARPGAGAAGAAATAGRRQCHRPRRGHRRGRLRTRHRRRDSRTGGGARHRRTRGARGARRHHAQGARGRDHHRGNAAALGRDDHRPRPHPGTPAPGLRDRGRTARAPCHAAKPRQ